MNTLIACINKAISEGFRDHYTVTPRGLYSLRLSRYYRPEQVQIVNFYRFEGESDPADNAILYLLETSDGSRGTLVDAYGTYSDPFVGQFVAQVNDIRKKLGSQNGRNFC